MPLIRTFTLFRVLGIPIRLDLSWLAVFALVTWTLASRVFPAESGLGGAGLAGPWLVGLAALTALLLFGSVLLHELGHAVVARRSHLPIRGITLFLFGGVAELAREPDAPGQELKMAIAGPAVSAVLCGVFAGIASAPASALSFVPRLDAVQAIARFLATVNAGLLVFNMIPGFPLDGGRVLRACLWWATGSLVRATRIATIAGSAVGLVLMLFGAFQAFSGAVVPGLWLAFIGLFLGRAARSSYEHVRLKRALDGLRVRDVLREPAAAVLPGVLLERFVAEHVPRHRCEAYVVVDGFGRPVGVLDLGEIARLPRGRRATATVGEVMRPLDGAPILPLDASATGAFEAARPGGIAIVVEPGEGPEGGFRGFVLAKDVVEAARLRARLGI